MYRGRKPAGGAASTIVTNVQSQIFTKFIIGGRYPRRRISLHPRTFNTLHRLQHRVRRRRPDRPQFRRFHEEFLEFRDDVLAVSVLAERPDVRPDLVHQHLALRRLRHVDHLLHNVVRVLILHHHVESTANYKYQLR